MLAGTSGGTAPDEAVPLSFGQQGILLSKLRAAPGSANQYVRLPLDPEPSDEAAVQRFLQLLIARNDALRATLVRSPGGAGLVFRPAGTAAGPLGPVPHQAIDERLLTTEFKRGGPLFLAAVDPSDPGAVHLVLDHLIFDGWSHTLLVEEAARIWRHVALGAELPSPGGSLRGYLERQRTMSERGGLDDYTRFWRRAFDHDLTVGIPRRGQRTWQHIVFPCPEGIRGKLTHARRQFRTTDFAIIAAAFATALLSHTSAQRSLLIYSPVADRDETTLDTIGCLLNFVGIRINLGVSIAETIESARDGLIGALVHQHGPFFKVLPRTGSGALVTAQAYLLPTEELSHFPGTTTPIPASAADSWVLEECSPRPLGDLWFAFAHTKSGYCGELAFSNEYFDGETGLKIMHALLDVLMFGLVAG
jgi:Condensation domain